MRNRFTDKLEGVLQLAQNAAHDGGISEYGADYLLIGLTDFEGTTVAHPILDRVGISLKPFVDAYAVPKDNVSNEESRVADVFVDEMCNEARNLKHNYVGTEHLILAIARSDSTAGEFLRNAGADHKSLLDTLKKFRRGIFPCERPPLFDLPTDVNGRIACVLVGLLFGGAGTWLLVELISQGRGFDALKPYEFSALFAALGWTLFIWGLAKPAWLQKALDDLAAHIVFVIALLFAPFIIEAMGVLLGGEW